MQKVRQELYRTLISARELARNDKQYWRELINLTEGKDNQSFSICNRLFKKFLKNFSRIC